MLFRISQLPWSDFSWHVHRCAYFTRGTEDMAASEYLSGCLGQNITHVLYGRWHSIAGEIIKSSNVSQYGGNAIDREEYRGWKSH